MHVRSTAALLGVVCLSCGFGAHAFVPSTTRTSGMIGSTVGSPFRATTLEEPAVLNKPEEELDVDDQGKVAEKQPARHFFDSPISAQAHAFLSGRLVL